MLSSISLDRDTTKCVLDMLCPNIGKIMNREQNKLCDGEIKLEHIIMHPYLVDYKTRSKEIQTWLWYHAAGLIMHTDYFYYFPSFPSYFDKEINYRTLKVFRAWDLERSNYLHMTLMEYKKFKRGEKKAWARRYTKKNHKSFVNKYCKRVWKESYGVSVIHHLRQHRLYWARRSGRHVGNEPFIRPYWTAFRKKYCK